LGTFTIHAYGQTKDSVVQYGLNNERMKRTFTYTVVALIMAWVLCIAPIQKATYINGIFIAVLIMAEMSDIILELRDAIVKIIEAAANFFKKGP
jgi:hypothetical protein